MRDASELVTALNDRAIARIVLQPGTYELTTAMCSVAGSTAVAALCISRNVLLDAETPGTVVLSSARPLRLVYISTGVVVDMSGMNFTTSIADEQSHGGGGLHMAEYSTATLSKCNFYGSSSYAFDSAVLVSAGAKAELIDCSIHDNTAGKNFSSGVVVQGSATMIRCTVHNNTAGELCCTTQSGGGGVSIMPGADATMSNCSIYGNTCLNNNGGAGLWIAGAVTLNGCDIHHNLVKSGSSEAFGGGVRVTESGRATLVKCNIYRNTAQHGSGVQVDGSATLRGCSLNENGNLMAPNGNLMGAFWPGEQESISGGGLHVASSADATLIDCSICNNLANTSGGGVHIEMVGEGTDLGVHAGSVHALTAHRCSITGNHASDRGGGVHAESSTRMIQCSVSQNIAVEGAGVFIDSTDDVALVSCSIFENEASGKGGGMHVEGVASQRRVDMSDCSVYKNVARGVSPGAGLYLASPPQQRTTASIGVIALTDCRVFENSALEGRSHSNAAGGLLVCAGAIVELLRCHVYENTVDQPGRHGGGLLVAGAAALTNCSIHGNTVQSGGGGLLVWQGGRATLMESHVYANFAHGYWSWQAEIAGRPDHNDGGGIYAWGLVFLTHSTVHNNTAREGGNGVHVICASSPPHEYDPQCSGDGALNGGLVQTNSSIVDNAPSNLGGDGPVIFGPVPPPPPPVTHVYVDSAADLRAAVDDIAVSRIVVAPGYYVLPYGYSGHPDSFGALNFVRNVVVEAERPGTVVLDGAGFRVIRVHSGAVVDLIGLDITGTEGESGRAHFGGGVAVSGTARLMSCNIYQNKARFYGGGLHVGYSARAELTNCSIYECSAQWSGGGLMSYGTLIMTNCDIYNNSGGSGGGIFVWYGIATLDGCAIHDNNGGAAGGGLEVRRLARLTNCVIHSNRASRGAGLLVVGTHHWSGGGDAILTNCGIYGNTASQGGAGICVGHGYASRYGDRPGFMVLNSCSIHANKAELVIACPRTLLQISSPA